MEKFCEKCDDVVRRNERHDAYFCATCDEWRSTVCMAPGEVCHAGYCNGRPERPSQVVS